jgi:N-acetylglutamate synthase-like GNAT family acetyltransferase
MNYSDIQSQVEMLGYDDNYVTFFKDLNMAWLQKYFYVEPIDEEMLSNPRQYIIDKGGAIFFAKYKSSIVGTFALMQISSGCFELGKMAVNENFQGLKIGNAMLRFCLKKGKEMGAKKIVLFSNTKLGPAIHLYKKFGFVEIPIGDSEYKRSNIKMERDLSIL